MDFPKPRRPKGRSDMPRKASAQCAASGTCKVENKKFAKKKAVSKMSDNDGDEADYVRPKFESGGGGDAEAKRKLKKFKMGGKATGSYSTYSKNNRSASDGTNYYSR